MLKKTIYNVTPMFDEEHIFHTRGWRVVDHPDQADFLLFSGGADINPMRYNQARLQYTHTNEQRDEVEFLIAQK